jgi:hypothetical protein
LIQECACVGLCVTFDRSKMRSSSTKSNCHRQMNRRPVGSSVGLSGEGVFALSSSLLENFLLSDEPTPTCFTPAVHLVLKEFSSFHRPARKSSDMFFFAGRRIIRWLVSPRSRTAPTVRPMLSIFYRRFIRRYSKAWVPSVITGGGHLLTPKP